MKRSNYSEMGLWLLRFRESKNPQKNRSQNESGFLNEYLTIFYKSNLIPCASIGEML